MTLLYFALVGKRQRSTGLDLSYTIEAQIRGSEPIVDETKIIICSYQATSKAGEQY